MCDDEMNSNYPLQSKKLLKFGIRILSQQEFFTQTYLSLAALRPVKRRRKAANTNKDKDKSQELVKP